MTVILHDSQSERPVALREACLRFFDGAISVASLKAEARRGNLAISKIGRAYFTTELAVNAMVEKCRVKAEVPISLPTTSVERGQSSTVNARSEQASLLQTVAALKKRSKPTSDRNTRS
jgi:hypothetical protein